MDSTPEAADKSMRVVWKGGSFILRTATSFADGLSEFLTEELNSHVYTPGRQRIHELIESNDPLDMFPIPRDKLSLFHTAAMVCDIPFCFLNKRNDPSHEVNVLYRARDSERMLQMLASVGLDHDLTGYVIHDRPEDRAPDADSGKTPDAGDPGLSGDSGPCGNPPMDAPAGAAREILRPVRRKPEKNAAESPGAPGTPEEASQGRAPVRGPRRQKNAHASSRGSSGPSAVRSGSRGHSRER